MDHIFNKAKAERMVDFSGLKSGAIRPSDIDGAIELRDKIFITLEFKEGTRILDKGQFILLQRFNKLQHEALVARCNGDQPEEHGMIAITLVCEHGDCDMPDGATSLVRGAFHEGRWKKYEDKKTLVEVLNILGEKLNSPQLKSIGQ